jgi:STE24 endopeptidase
MSEMTATRMTRLGTIVLAAGLWLGAAAFLWHTTVPDLRLPNLDPHAFFGRRILHRAADFAGFLRYEWLAATLVQLAVLFALSRLGRRIAGGFALGRIGTGVMVGAVVTTALWLAGLPFGLAQLWWERRYGQSTRGYASWLLEQWPSVIGQVIGLTILLTLLLLLAGRFRRHWWALAAPIVLGVAAAFALLQPLLASVGTHGVRNPRLAADIRMLERKDGISGTPVRVEKTSGESPAVNAETLGYGPTTRVILWDTLLDGRFDRGEVRFVTAHELGHVERRHIWRGLGWSALFTVPLLALTAAVTRRRGGLALPENVPLALLTLAVAGVVVTPLGNAISRRYEAEADWIALQTTHDPGSARGMFKAFSTADLAQPDPPFWSYVMLDDHPTTMQRLAMVAAWERRNR